MLRIKAVCLGHKQEFIDNYQTIQELRDAAYVKYNKYFMSKNVKEIWDGCCQCLSSFTIALNQIPCECDNPECGYQYCNDCVRVMKRITPGNKKICCIYCGHLSSEGPRQNQLLLDLLWEHYLVKYGVESVPATNIMPGTLSNDIDCRVIHLKSLMQTLKGKMNQSNCMIEPVKSEIERANILIEKLEKVKEATKIFLSTVADDIDDNKLNDHLKEYINLLTGGHVINRKFEHFISICEQLLYYNQKAEFEKYFPSLNKLMNKWEHLSNTEEKFQLNIIEAFKAIQLDLGQHIIPSVPLKIGFLGNISVGKTSLLNWLRGITSNTKADEYLQNETTNNNILASPVRVGKSTYCHLEFEHVYDNGKKITFVDIEGSTDTDFCLKSANYFDEIVKADCDLYIIVFDQQFTDVQYRWHDYIVDQMHRKCWFVRSKADGLFRSMFKEDVGQDFDVATYAAKNKYGTKIVERIRDTINVDIQGRKLSKVYLTSTCYDENLSEMSYSKFDLDELLNDIQKLPLSWHGNRLQKMAVNAMARVVNNCLRRGYVVNVMKYKIAAGVAALVPFVDLIPRYYGREEIRQAFGVNTRSRLSNWYNGTTDEFKDYLKEFNIAVDESTFNTSAFRNTFRKESTVTSKPIENVTSVIVKGATTASVAGVASISASDDIIRASGIGAINAVRGVSISLLVVGAVLSVGVCAWAAVDNGRQMYDYLNRLCDDLIILSDYVTVEMIKVNDSIRDSFTKTE